MQKIGKPCAAHQEKWDEDRFYCSQLVFHAWHDVNSEYNLASTAGIWVLSSDIVKPNLICFVTFYVEQLQLKEKINEKSPFLAALVHIVPKRQGTKD